MVEEKKLIFIISQPRSGSTFLQAVISNHPKIDTTSEHFMLLPFLSIFNPTLVKTDYDFSLACDAFWDFQQKIDNVSAFIKEYKELLLKQYSHILTAPDNYVLDKTPRYYEIFDDIYRMFPEARFIILKRHPVAVLRSIVLTWHSNSFKKLKDHHKSDLFNAPFIIRRIEEKYSSRDNVKIIKYEDMLSNTDVILQQLFDWFGLEYRQEFKDISGNEKYVGKYGDPTGVKKNKKPVKENTDMWKQDLNDKEIGYLLNGYGAFLGEKFLSDYGYDDKIDFRSNMKFRLFLSYCNRSVSTVKSSVKDIALKIILKIFAKSEIGK